MYTAWYGDSGNFTGVRTDTQDIPQSTQQHWHRFLEWLKAQGKTLDEFKAENPYVPRTPVVDPDKATTDRIKANADNLSAADKSDLLKLLAKRL